MIFDEKMERKYRTYAPFLSIYNFVDLFDIHMQCPCNFLWFLFVVVSPDQDFTGGFFQCVN